MLCCSLQERPWTIFPCVRFLIPDEKWLGCPRAGLFFDHNRFSLRSLTESTRSFVSSHLRPRLLFVALMAASVALFWVPLRQLEELALSSDPYSYILLIPVISAFVVYMERRTVFANIGTHRSPGAVAALAGVLAIFGLLAGLLVIRAANLSAEYALSIKAMSIVLVWAAVFALCYGVHALRAASFPFLLLLLLVPIPSHLMDTIVTNLQWGAAEATYALFQLAGVPMFRNGVNFELPVISIEVVRECSSIHSACALFIAGLLVGHLFLKSLRAKVCLTLLTIPIAMFTNAVRIVTLWFLATKVDIGFIYGDLHRKGGILFSLVSLSILMGFLHLLRKVEGHARTMDRNLG